jgi:isoquinoline 1-oxidoreductase subunit beta
MSAPATVGRREFLKTGAAAGGGLLVSWYLPMSGAARDAAGENQVALNAFVRIGTDESVTVISSHSEMGQGIYTSLPMLLNEELEADWAKIRVEAAPVDKVYNHPVFGMQMTGGSTTSPAEWEHYRKMGALARTMLVTAAAQQWDVDAASCQVEKGVVLHRASGRHATYGALATAAAKLTPPSEVKLKDASSFTLIGKPTRRLDTPSKTNGTAQFGLDVSLPGMLTAVVARPPVFGGKVAKVDATEALKVPGVKAVEQVESGVAVIAERFWPAKVGRDKLVVEWDLGPNAGLSSEQMLRDFAEQAKSPGIVAKKTGDPANALKTAAFELRGRPARGQL